MVDHGVGWYRAENFETLLSEKYQVDGRLNFHFRANKHTFVMTRTKQKFAREENV